MRVGVRRSGRPVNASEVPAVSAGAPATSGTATLQIDGNRDIAGGSDSDTVDFTMTFV